MDRRVRTEEAEESVEAEVMSMSPSEHGRSQGGKEVRKGHEQPKERTRKGANPDIAGVRGLRIPVGAFGTLLCPTLSGF
jgi:hypothetical protein